MLEGREVDALNAAKYLYLRDLSEPQDNSLRLVVQEAVANKFAPVPHSDLPELAAILENAAPIESVEGCMSFEIVWERYVAYIVTEEGAGSCGTDSDEAFAGRMLRTYTKSHFLDHLARDTGGHMKPIQHYKLICLNHLIDVASYEPPHIRIIGQSANIQ